VTVEVDPTCTVASSEGKAAAKKILASVMGGKDTRYKVKKKK